MVGKEEDCSAGLQGKKWLKEKKGGRNVFRSCQALSGLKRGRGFYSRTLNSANSRLFDLVRKGS